MFVNVTHFENQLTAAGFLAYALMLKSERWALMVYGAAGAWYVELAAITPTLKTRCLWDVADRATGLLLASHLEEVLAAYGATPDEELPLAPYLQECAAFGSQVSSEWIRAMAPPVPRHL
ncbi:MAG TPA: hypothetical protein V6D05_04910 [Stenomitos sp.]